MVMTNLHRSPPVNQSRTDLEIVNESQLPRLGIRLRTDNSGDRLSPSGSSLVAANLRLAGLRYVSKFPGAKGFPRFLGKITRRIPFRSHRCAFQAHQAGRTARRRRSLPAALTRGCRALGDLVTHAQ